ncbi:MFS multidrug transporter-like protein [Amylocarpus encephaloides]|uniref:MFS multidrug transporter-like protein n=1 Tax=Amylocarpus encephaloides TaxID=45428 RepID=A0A9P7YRE6_9HELO|nr:MFS multidrug transporter-like protein [Amylocarpus encephaloides]
MYELEPKNISYTATIELGVKTPELLVDSLNPERGSGETGTEVQEYLAGWKLHLLTICLCFSIFMPNIEVSIVSTALVNITNELHGFSETGWVVVSYLTPYTAFIIIWAKLSDVVGRKLALATSLVIFTAFSGACGSAQTITQLIICRAFQGVGAAGCFSIATVILFEMVPKERYPVYGSIISADVALAMTLGPIVGGVITEETTWRWVFLFNVPMGIATLIALLISMPAGFPHLGSTSKADLAFRNIFSPASFLRIDAFGTVLFLGTSLLFVTSLLETSTRFSWKSPVTISLLVISGVFLLVFLIWERYITIGPSKQEPIFPWRFVQNRAWMGMTLVSLLLGIPFTVLVVNIPQKFQLIDGLSPLQAGIRLLPYALLAPIGSFAANGFMSRAKSFSPVFLVLAGATLQLIGLGLYSGLAISKHPGKMQFGFQAIAGFGLGISFGTLILMTPFSVEAQDLATGTGAIVQSRQLGSAIGLSMAQSLMNSQLKSKLTSLLTSQELARLLQTTTAVKTFSPELRARVIEVFSDAYGLQIKVITGFAAAELLAVMLIMKRRQIKVG